MQPASQLSVDTQEAGLSDVVSVLFGSGCEHADSVQVANQSNVINPVTSTYHEGCVRVHQSLTQFPYRTAFTH